MRKARTIEEYQKALELLYKYKYSIRKVARELNIPRTTIQRWLKGSKPILSWTPKPTPELAYVIGVLMGDGHLHLRKKNHYSIELEVKDLAFACEFSRTLAKVLNKPFRKPYWRKDRHRWTVYYYSKAFYIWFKEQTLKTLKKYIEHDKETVGAFLRGIYDSEGSNWRCKRISVYNTSLMLLRYIQYLLNKVF